MSENPYQPPTAPLEVQSDLALEGTGSFRIRQCLTDAWEDTWQNFPLWLGVGFVGLVLLLLSALSVVGFPIVAPVLVWGATLFCLNMTDRRAAFTDLFAGFGRFGSVWARMLSLIVLIFLLSLPGSVVQSVGVLAESERLAAVGVAISLVWTLLVVARLAFAYLFLVDRDLGPIQAISAAWQVTRGNGLRVAALVGLSYCVLVAGFLALGVGLIPASVILYLLWTSAYRQMVGR